MKTQSKMKNIKLTFGNEEKYIFLLSHRKKIYARNMNGENKLITLYRIQAIKDIKDPSGKILVKKGELGGWIQSGKNLSQSGSCWIYDDAIVCQDATVENSAIVKNNASVGGLAEISENAIVGGNAIIYNSACVRGNAKVVGHAIVYDGAEVYDNATVGGYAKVSGYAQIHGDAILSGTANIRNHSNISEGIYLGNQNGNYFNK